MGTSGTTRLLRTAFLSAMVVLAILAGARGALYDHVLADLLLCLVFGVSCAQFCVYDAKLRSKQVTHEDHVRREHRQPH